MRILLIEDDRKAARLLAKGLLEEGFVVDVAPTGEDGEEKATVNEYDVIVLENMFGDILSDLGAATVGGLGMAPSGDVGERWALFQRHRRG